MTEHILKLKGIKQNVINLVSPHCAKLLLKYALQMGASSFNPKGSVNILEVIFDKRINL